MLDVDVAATRLTRALVTGASSGLGEEFCRQLAARGMDLVVVARRGDRLHALSQSLRRAHGAEVEVLVADLGSEVGVAAVVDRLHGAEAPVDLLVNNAGFGLYGDFADQDPARVADLLDVNVRAVVALSRAALPRLIERQRGGIINVASTASFQPDPYAAVYGASKAFVRSFSEALHEEVRGDGVRVLALCPGYTVTEFQAVADVTRNPLPDWAAPSAESVVSAGLHGFTRGDAVVVPGLVNRVAASAAAAGPSSIARRVSARVHRAMVGRS